MMVKSEIDFPELFEEQVEGSIIGLAKLIYDFITKKGNTTFFAVVLTPEGGHWFAKNVDIQNPKFHKIFEKNWEEMKKNFATNETKLFIKEKK